MYRIVWCNSSRIARPMSCSREQTFHRPIVQGWQVPQRGCVLPSPAILWTSFEHALPPREPQKYPPSRTFVNKVYQSLRASIADILRDEGVAGYYRGVMTSLLQIAPYMGILFGTYEPTRHFLTQRSPLSPRTSDFLAGGIAGVVSKCAVFPLDTVRKRLQVQGPTRGRYVYADIPVYGGGIWAAVREIMAREGVRGLYRGLGVALLKSGPSAAVTLWVFDGCLHLWEWVHYRPGRGGTWHD
jgi:hypothetical protein